MTPEAYSEAVAKVNPMSGKYLPGQIDGKPTEGITWCNVFVADLADELRIILPHKKANEQILWLDAADGGRGLGWDRVDAVDARKNANAGKFTLATWFNDKGHGHISAVVPFNSAAVWIAQAGFRNYLAVQLAAGFGSYPVRFFTFSR